MFADVNFYFLAVKKCADVDQETITTSVYDEESL